MIALYLHYSYVRESNGVGLTVSSFQAFCTKVNLCSSGRASALLLMLKCTSYIEPAPDLANRRQRRLIPTERLIEEQRQSWTHLFDAMALIVPEGALWRNLLNRPKFMAAFVCHLGVTYLAGFRVLSYAPDLARIVESNAGLLVFLSLFLAATNDPARSSGTAVTVSLSALSKQFGIARAHARNLLSDAVATGLLTRSDMNMTVIVLPRLKQAVSDFFAATFALFAHCASAAAAEIAD